MSVDLAVAVRLMRLAQFIRSDLASIPVSARSGDFSEEISERFQIPADSEEFKIFSEDSSEEMPFFFGNADLAVAVRLMCLRSVSVTYG